MVKTNDARNYRYPFLPFNLLVKAVRWSESVRADKSSISSCVDDISSKEILKKPILNPAKILYPGGYRISISRFKLFSQNQNYKRSFFNP